LYIVYEVKDRILQLVGDLPRIELFAREKTEGWDVWGNEVESDIDLAMLKEDK
jgi:N6-adenosine-specific RNA methylase IME4